MRFDALKEKTIEGARLEQEVREAGHRDWICPDMTLISVTIRPSRYVDEAAEISMSISLWRKEDGARSTLSDGRVFTDGYFDHVYDPLLRGSLTAKQLEYVVRARLVCESYVEGHSSELPATIF